MPGRQEVRAPPWYAHPVFARYWSHYRETQTWVQRHRRARRRALAEAAQCLDWSGLAGLPFPYDPSHADDAGSCHDDQSHAPVLRHNHWSAQAAEHQKPHHHHQRQHHHHHHQQQHQQQQLHYHQQELHEEVPEHHHSSTQASGHQRAHQRQHHYHHNQHQHHNQQQHYDHRNQQHHWQQPHEEEEVPDLRSEEADEDSDPVSESEEASDVEITEELRAYFAETERHREERRLEQELECERVEGMVWADEPPRARQASSRAPLERPGERRRVEMARLYGQRGSTRILALEAAMQLIFDQQCDRAQPKYWPIIALKL